MIFKRVVILAALFSTTLFMIPSAAAQGGPAVSLSSQFLDFDKQVINTKSLLQIVTVTNTGNMPLTFTSIMASGNAFETDSCLSLANGLAPGAMCTIDVTIQPTMVCTPDGSISITDNAPNSPQKITTFGYGSGDNGLMVKDVNMLDGANPLVNALLGPGITASNITYTGVGVAAGTFSTFGNGNIIGFSNGIVLSTGSVHNVVGPNCDTGISRDNGLNGIPELNAIVAPDVTFDPAVLQFDFVPTSNFITFQYVFASDEYPEFVGSFNDVFAFFLNGTNIALLPGVVPPTPVSINNVNGGNPIGTNPKNPQFYIDNNCQLPVVPPNCPNKVVPLNTEMDGLTVVLTAQAAVNPGVMNHIELAIADTADHALDSNVFLKGGSLVSTAVTFAPAALAFDKQSVGTTSAAQNVTVTNVGMASLTISSISASGDFSETDTCKAPLAQNATCIIMVTVTPKAVGPLNGLITINDNDPSSPQTVPLSGNGTAPTTPGTFSAAPGSSMQVTIIPGDTAVFTLLFKPNPGVEGPFTFTCDRSAIPNTICTITVSGPNADGSFTVTVNLRTNCTSVGMLGPAPRSLPPGWGLPLGMLWLLALTGWLWSIRRGGKLALPPAVSRRLGWATSSLAVVLLLATCAGCTAAMAPAPFPNAPTTPKGNFVIKVTGMAPSGVTPPLPLNVNVI